MKTFYLHIAACVVSGSLFACTTEIERPKVVGFVDDEPKTLDVSSEEVIMEGIQEDNVALVLTWEEYSLAIDNDDYGVPAGSIRHFVEMSVSEDFESFETVEVVEGNEMEFTENGLTSILLSMGYEPWVKAPLYIRIRYALSDNIDYRYSTAVEIQVSPYGIRNNRMDVLAADKENVLFSIWSPEENGIYSGYVGASSWMNYYLKDRSNTIWGAEPDAGAFVMTNNAQNMWNLWFPQPAGSYYITADTNEKRWEAVCLHDLAITSSTGDVTPMKFKISENTWSANITTAGAETFTATAWTWVYNQTNEGGVDGDPIEFGQIVTIPEAGNWTLYFNLSGMEPTASYVVNDAPAVTYDPYLEMIDINDHSLVKCRLYSPAGDGVYNGFYYADAWEKFFLASVGREVIYGSKPGAQNELSDETGKYDIWMPTGEETFNLVTASLPDMEWSTVTFSKMTVAGEFNGGDVSADQMMFDKENKVWTADLDITAVGWGLMILLDEDWAKCFKHKSDGVLGYLEGSDIIPPGTGRYRLTVDLFDMGNLTYKFESIY